MEPAARPNVMSAEQVLEREYLEMRARLLELAAFFDRLDRGGGVPTQDVRLQKLRQAAELILEASENRAEQLQMLFSRPYDVDWRDKYRLAPR
jgi:hypothetical protein